jgi:geranylgeranyl diphosphate synthase type I
MTSTDETVTGRSARKVLAWSRDLVDPALREAVGALPEATRTIAGYHFGWWDEHERPTADGGGKAIRPALTLLTAEAVGGAAAEAVPAAVAIELVHNFSLLHDDVMDGDTTRRHRATAWTVFGRSSAILAGDALLTLAFDVLAATGSRAGREGMRTLSAAVLDLIAGQNADMALEQRTDVELAECLAMARRKTAALLGCATALGASFGGGDAGRVAHLRDFGERLGLVFQLVDDLLGIWGDPAVTGKPVRSDLHNRKKSLPVVAALTSGSAAGRELATLYHGDEPMTDDDTARAAGLIELAGGRSWSRSYADELMGQALDSLVSAGPAVRPSAELGALARLITCRDH